MIYFQLVPKPAVSVMYACQVLLFVAAVVTQLAVELASRGVCEKSISIQSRSPGMQLRTTRISVACRTFI